MHLDLCRRIQERFFRIDPAACNLERAINSSAVRWWLGALLAAVPLAGANARIDLVSAPAASLPAGVFAAGDSFSLGATPDGSQVLFASMAQNLALGASGRGYIDLYLACRTNGVVARVSAAVPGLSGPHGNSTWGSVTPDGRYVAFESDAGDLVTNEVSQAGDVFVRDLQAGTTRLVSVNLPGTAGGHGASWSPVITPDGRFVAFVSAADDLVAGDENGIQDIFVRDLRQGTTVLVSQGAVCSWYGRSSLPVAGSSHSPVITPDGRFVAFTSAESNLVTGMRGVYEEVFVRDLVKGQTIWVNEKFPATRNMGSYNPSLSDDGRYVAFKNLSEYRYSVARYTLETMSLELIATNVAGFDTVADEDYGPALSPDGRFVAFADAIATNGTSSVWLWDGQTKSTALVSANLNGEPSRNGRCDSAALTPDGRYVAFVSNGTDLHAQAVDGEFQVYVRDLRAGTTELASLNELGEGAGALGNAVPSLSSDGRFVVFDSRGESLVPGDRNHAYDVFTRDLTAATTELLSHAATNLPAATANGDSVTGVNALSADGRLVVFESEASDLVPGDTNGLRDVFVRDLQLGSNILVSVNQFGTGSAHGASRSASISANGQYVVFISAANDLIPDDPDPMEKIFVRDLQAGTTRPVSGSTDWLSADRVSSSPSLSADGRFVAFQSSATDLAPRGQPAPIASVDVFVRDLVAEMTWLVSSESYTAGEAPVLIGADGRFVAYQPVSTERTYPDLLLTEPQTGVLLTLGSNVPAKAFSGDGRKLAYLEIDAQSESHTLVLADLVQGTSTRLPLGAATWWSRPAVSASADGRWVALSTRAPLVGPGPDAGEDVLICDVPNANLTLASVNRLGTAGGNGESGSPRISADGRYVAFRSAASDLAPDEAGGREFLFDRLTGRTTRLSPSTDGIASTPGTSLGLDLTPDGNRVVFSSFVSDLVSGDFNGAVDVFTVGIEQSIPPSQPSTIRLTETVQQGGVTTIRWSATPGCSYRVESRDSLAASGWQDLPGVVVIAGAEAWLADRSGTNAPQRFYRVRRVE